MTTATHLIVGAAIGKNIDNPGLIILFSIIIHFILDHFKHGEYVDAMNSKTAVRNTYWKILMDFTVGLSIIFACIKIGKVNSSTVGDMGLGMMASVFPDFLTALYWKFRIKPLEIIYRFHSWIHKFPRFSPEREWNLKNARNDILFSLIAIVIILIF
jgi:hypothetical protein